MKFQYKQKFNKDLPFVFRNVIDENSPKALSEHLMDKDAAALMKKAYPGSSMHDVLDDEDACVAFFGSKAAANQALDGYSQAHWDSLGNSIM